MTKEQSMRSQIKPRFVDYLKAAELPYVHPELTNCPHCNQHASVIQNWMWLCPECHKHGDVVDYVMALEHLDTEWTAIKRICRTLQIKVTTLDVIHADELMDKQFEKLIKGLGCFPTRSTDGGYRRALLAKYVHIAGKNARWVPSCPAC